MLITLDARCRGSEHIKTDKPLQDFSFSTVQKHVGYAFVADGHGGDKYIRSGKGAEFACWCAAQIIVNIRKEFLAEIKRLTSENKLQKRNHLVSQNLKLMCSKLPTLWRDKIKEHFQTVPLSEEEIKLCENAKILLPLKDDDIPALYGTTLLIAVYFEQQNFWFSLQIGDGRSYVMTENAPATFFTGKVEESECQEIKNDGNVLSPIPEDEEQGFGVTKSLCSKNAGMHFRYAFGFEKLSGVAVMSDGLTDSFDTEKLPDFLLSIQKNAVADAENAKRELEAFLPKLSEQGSGDDISIAGIFVKEEESRVRNILNKVGSLI